MLEEALRARYIPRARLRKTKQAIIDQSRPESLK